MIVGGLGPWGSGHPEQLHAIRKVKRKDGAGTGSGEGSVLLDQCVVRVKLAICGVHFHAISLDNLDPQHSVCGGLWLDWGSRSN